MTDEKDKWTIKPIPAMTDKQKQAAERALAAWWDAALEDDYTDDYVDEIKAVATILGVPSPTTEYEEEKAEKYAKWLAEAPLREQRAQKQAQKALASIGPPRKENWEKHLGECHFDEMAASWANQLNQSIYTDLRPKIANP